MAQLKNQKRKIRRRSRIKGLKNKPSSLCRHQLFSAKKSLRDCSRSTDREACLTKAGRDATKKLIRYQCLNVLQEFSKKFDHFVSNKKAFSHLEKRRGRLVKMKKKTGLCLNEKRKVVRKINSCFRTKDFKKCSEKLKIKYEEKLTQKECSVELEQIADFVDRKIETKSSLQRLSIKETGSNKKCLERKKRSLQLAKSCGKESSSKKKVSCFKNMKFKNWFREMEKECQQETDDVNDLIERLLETN